MDRDNRTVTQVVDYPDSSTNAQQIAVNGLLVESVSKTGVQTAYTYDALGRQTSVLAYSGAGTPPSRSVATYTTYNTLGQVASTMDGASNVTTYAYDTQGRRTQVTDAHSNTTHTAYDAEGRVLATWGATYPVAYDYDDYGRMTAMYTLRDSSLVISNYSSFITHTSSLDRTTWSYDLATGLLTNKLYADNKGPSYTYTADGKLATRTWARGITTSYSYDSMGQLTNITYGQPQGYPATPSVTFTYDRLGRQTTITDGQGTRTITYNNALQLVSESDPLLGGAGGGSLLSRTYDSHGRPAGLTLGSDYEVEYGYDSVGRFSSVASSTAGGPLPTAHYSYLPGSDLVQGYTNDTGLAVTRSYEPNRNLITRMRNTSGSTLLSQYDYANDAVGRRTSVGMAGDAFSDLGVSHNKYAYNERSELIQAKRYGGTNLASTANAIDGQAYLYDYDLIGNRTEVYTGDMLNGSRHTYTANALNQYTQKTVPAKARVMGSAASDATVTVNNQATTRYGQYFQSYLDIANSSSAAYPLISVTGVKKNAGSNNLDVVSVSTGHVFVARTPESFTYDDDGNMTQDGRWSYTWDGENRLIGMETLTNLPAAVPRVKLTFAYDYMSRRVSKTVSTNSSVIIYTSSFLYDGWAMIRELITDHGSPVTNSYTYGLDLSGTQQGAGTIGGLLALTTQQPDNSTTAFYAYDANGNVGQLVSTNGTLLAQYEYDPYGNPLKTVAAASVAANPFRFSTKYADPETGLLYYGYRYYMPETGRWANRDPIGEYAFRYFTIGHIERDFQQIMRKMEARVRARCRFLQTEKLYQDADRLMAKWMEVDTYIHAIFQEKHFAVYTACANNAVNVYDYLGLDYASDLLDCQDRCTKMAEAVPCPNEFLNKCFDNCAKDPGYIPSIPDLMTPPATPPGWDFNNWKNNWKDILDALLELYDWLHEKIKG